MASLVRPPVLKDETLQNPRCVFQIVKRHFSRYTPEMVEKATGCPKEIFLKVAETILANSGADRTTSFAYAVAWTQHTYGVQIIGACALLQLLLGNIGRPGAGVMALRGHASIQGSTDIPTLYHSIQGYMTAPTALKKHDTLQDYIAAETIPTGYWANMPKFMVSYLKSVYGDAATKENQFGYDWHPKILGDHSHMAMFAAMNAGEVKGMICVGQNPATSLNAKLDRSALEEARMAGREGQLDHRDRQLLEDCAGGQKRRGEDGGHQDRSVLLAGHPGRRARRHLHEHAAPAAVSSQSRRGARRLPVRYLVQLRSRQAAEEALRQFHCCRATRGLRIWSGTTSTRTSNERKKGEPSALKILKEINGFFTEDPARHCVGFGELKDDGSTTCASWIYSGVYPAAGQASCRQAHARPAR